MLKTALMQKDGLAYWQTTKVMSVIHPIPGYFLVGCTRVVITIILGLVLLNLLRALF